MEDGGLRRQDCIAVCLSGYTPPLTIYSPQGFVGRIPIRTRYRITSHDQTSRRLRPSPESLTVYTGSFMWIYRPHGRCTTQHRYCVNLTATSVSPLDTKCPLLFSNQPSIPFVDLSSTQAPCQILLTPTQQVPICWRNGIPLTRSALHSITVELLSCRVPCTS